MYRNDRSSYNVSKRPHLKNHSPALAVVRLDKSRDCSIIKLLDTIGAVIYNCRGMSRRGVFLVLLVLCTAAWAEESGGEKFDADTHAIEKGERTVIHIENSRFTSFEKGKGASGDTITLEGDARVSIEKDGTSSVIRADVIRLDRENSMLYASGNVIVKQSKGSKSAAGEEVTETSAKSIFLNTSTMEGVFEDGKVVKLMEGSTADAANALVVESSLFGKGKNTVIGFKNGMLTFCDDDDPHWHINASRIWMLPAGEFAFFNALLYVGETPVLYLPAFYYPKDELIFNPVFGYDNKMGYFVQTTAYLYGRKSLDAYDTAPSTSSTGVEEDSAFNFIKPTSLKEQRLEGIVLHNLDKDYEGQTQNFVKLMADWYGNLGYGFGVDSSFTGLDGAISSIKAGGKMGFTQTVFCNSALHWSPYSPSGKSYDDNANFTGFYTPFRYETNFELSLVKPFTMNIKLPIYSDPFFHGDFASRSETMDWINYLITSSKGNNSEDEEEDDVDKDRTGINNFEWRVDTSYNLTPPSKITPYLSSASVSTNSMISFATTVNEKLREDTSAVDSDAVMLRSPNQKFFYPSQITPISADFSFSGTIYQFNESDRQIEKNAKKYKKGEKAGENMTAPEELKSNSEKAKESGEEEGEEGKGEEKGEEGALNSFDALPYLNMQDGSAKAVSGFTYGLSYNFKPQYSSQIAYSSSALKGPDDFDWSNKKSYMYTLRLPVSVTNAFTVGKEVAKLNNTLTYDPFLQDHPYLSYDEDEGGYSESEADSVKEADYKATKQTISSSSTLSIKPFYYVPHFKDTGISYKQDVKLFKTNFIGDADNPKWEYLTTDWTDEDFVPTHQIQAVFAATEGYNDAIGQTLTLTATLPPRPDEYNAALALFVPHIQYDVSTGIKQKSSEDDTWVKQDLKMALTITLFDSMPLSFTASYNYNLEENYHDSLKLALDWQGLQAAYQMSYTNGYDFIEGDGWKKREEEEFLPYSFSLAYAPAPWTIHRWKNRIALKAGINTSIVSDLLRPTDSYFIFEPSIGFSIHDCFNIAFGATTKNSVIYRYVQKMFGCDGRMPGEDNLWKDLIDSFRFDNEDLRKASGFKLKSINIEITHSLHDWNLKALYRMTPRLVTEGKNKHYDFDPYATISVVWRPMSSMKSEIRDDYGHWQLNP